MATVTIKSSGSGTGNFTLEPPTTNTDRTLVLPDEAGTVLTNGSLLDSSNLTGAFNVDSSAPAQTITIDSNGAFYVGTTDRYGSSTFFGTQAVGSGAAIGLVDEDGNNGTLGMGGGGDLVIRSFSGPVVARDQNNNSTVISPHNFEMIQSGPSEEMAWAFYSRRGDIEEDFENTKYIASDITRVIRKVEDLTGEKLLYTGNGSAFDDIQPNENIIKDLLDKIDDLTNRIITLESQ